MRILVSDKKKFFIIFAFLFLFAFAGCSSKEKADDGKLDVYTSFWPVYDFASKIGADKINVKNLVPASAEPHDWEPTPEDMQNIADADMFIYNGYSMEPWLDKLIEAVQNDNLIVVEAGADIVSDKDASEADPHIWLSLKNAVKEMENIKNALCLADEKNSQFYEENFKKYKSEFEALDNEFYEFISNCSQKNIITAHSAFYYLCHDYGLNQISIRGLSPEEEPSPAMMAEIVDFAKQNNIKYVFFEPSSDKKTAQTIADEINGEILPLDPLECLSEEQIKNGEDYLSIMRKNLNALKTALY